MAPPRSSDEVAAALGGRLGGTVRGLRRLSGGASRVTSAFELPRTGLAPTGILKTVVVSSFFSSSSSFFAGAFFLFSLLIST